MGNWRDRPRRFRRPKSPPPPKDYPPEPLEFWRDGIPLWEKQFCVGVGSVPWRKIVDTKKIMLFHSNVVNWDDSASETAFHNAKRRYWAEINGADCGIPLPDHDLYIDAIDWNPTIDSKLIDDLDLAHFEPGEEQSPDKLDSKKNNEEEEQSRNADNNAENPWECSIKQGTTLLKNMDEWNTWNIKVTEGNPWEQGFKDFSKSSHKLNNWRSPVKDKVRGDSRNKAGGQSSSHCYSQNKRSPKEREWVNYGDHSCGWKQRKKEELRREEWGASINTGTREVSYRNEYKYGHRRDDYYQTAQFLGRGFP